MPISERIPSPSLSISVIDYNVNRLEHALDNAEENSANYDFFEDQPDFSGSNDRDYDRKLHCVTIADREFFIGQLHTWGKFFELDSEALVIAVNIFDRFISTNRISPEIHVCEYLSQCLTFHHGKRKASPCHQCNIFKVNMRKFINYLKFRRLCLI